MLQENIKRLLREIVGHEYVDVTFRGNAAIAAALGLVASGKKILNLDSMSGGEKSMTSLAFLFAILQHYASPFYVLDEVDAALDKANTKRVMSLVKRYSSSIQFIVISHSDTTIAEADKVYGVSMENGISKVFGIDLHGQHSDLPEETAEEEKTPSQQQ